MLIFPIYNTSAWGYAYDTSKSEDGFIISGAVGLNYRWTYGSIIWIDKDGNELWNKTYKGVYRAQIWRILDGEDGFILGGITGYDNDDAWIAKVDFEGNLKWQKIYGHKGDGESATSLAKDGKGVIAFLTIAPCENLRNENKCGVIDCPNKDTWIVKLDENGNEVWIKKIDSRDYDSIKSAKKISDGYIAVGVVGDYLEEAKYGNYDVWILKIDDKGETIWSKFFDFGYDDFAWDVVVFEDGYIVTGSASTLNLSQIELKRGNNENEDKNVSITRAFALKVDTSGNLEWIKFFDDGLLSSGWTVFDEERDIVLLGAGRDENGSFIWFKAINEKGDIIWSKEHRENFNFFIPTTGVVRALKLQDGYLVVSAVSNQSLFSCPWLGKFNKSGEVMWKKVYCLSEAQHKEFKFVENQDAKYGGEISFNIILPIATSLVICFLIILLLKRKV